MHAAGMAAGAASAGRAVTSLLQRTARTGDPIAQDCFKLLATLLRESESYKPTTAQLRFLLTWAFGDMEEAAHRQAAFALLKVSTGGGPSARIGFDCAGLLAARSNALTDRQNKISTMGNV